MHFYTHFGMYMNTFSNHIINVMQNIKMKNQKVLPLIKGVIKHFPLVKSLLPQRAGGTIDSRYCYSVWMRHLKNWSIINSELPKIVAELGPGDSLGTGFAALLSGYKDLRF
jgi:hypothetical protein